MKQLLDRKLSQLKVFLWRKKRSFLNERRATKIWKDVDAFWRIPFSGERGRNVEKARERKSFNVIREPLCASLESGSGSEREREGERYVTYVTLQCCVTVLGYTVLLDRRLHRVGVVLRLNTLMWRRTWIIARTWCSKERKSIGGPRSIISIATYWSFLPRF